MTKESDWEEYEDIIHLMKGDEWWTWRKFLENRTFFLAEKVLRLVHAKKYDEASCVEAVIFDIRRQLDAFRDRKGKLEEKLSNQNK